MADDRQRPGGAARGSTARHLAVQLGLFVAMFAVVLMVQEVVYRASGWDRLWILLVVVPLARAGTTVVQRRLYRRAAGAPGTGRQDRRVGHR